MVFVTGGAYSGKNDYVRGVLGIDKITSYGEDYDTLKNASAICGYHLYVRTVLRRGGDPIAETRRLLEDNPDVVIISDETGCGVVPADEWERKWREASGRVSCYLAEHAERAVRLVCGIATILK